MSVSDWKTDKQGRRYRIIGAGAIEYEPTVMVDGIEIPESMLKDYHAAKAARIATGAQKQREREQALNTGKTCPLGRIECRKDCAMYSGGCEMAHYASEGKRCPYNSQTCRRTCGMFRERIQTR